MKLFNWNTYGLGNPQGVRSLWDLLKLEAPNLVFLQKIKVIAFYILSKNFIFGFHFGIAVDSDGRSGGLAILWKSDGNFSVAHYSKHHIHSLLSLGLGYGDFWLLEIYGHPDPAQRPNI